MKTRSSIPSISTFMKCSDYESDLSQSSLSTKISSDAATPICKESRKRNRKNDIQVDVLIMEFKGNPNWSKETIKDLSEKTGLTEAQIYKWNWDYKKKNRGPFKFNFNDRLCCNESLAPSRYDSDIIELQRAYKRRFSDDELNSPDRVFV